jgi:hypothetical protein
MCNIYKMPEGKGTYGSKRGRPATKAKKVSIDVGGGDKIEFKEGTLRKQLKVPEGKTIPKSLLNKISKAEDGEMVMNPFTKKEMKVTKILKQRANLAKTLGKMKK